MKKVHLLLFVVILVLSSCSSNSENQITHLPFQTEEDGRWGLIDMEGNILIEDEFKSTPSVVIDGRFCVKNSDGLYEFYTAEKKFKQIGEEYLSVGYFSEGLAPVVKKDSRITYINKDGKVVFELTKYKDDPIEEAYPFENGIARVKTASRKYGCINTKGEFVVPPLYSSIFYAGENILLIKNEKEQWGYINYKGKTLVEPKYSDANGFNDNGYAMVEKDGKQIIINRKGKEILKLKDDMKISSWADENLMPYSIDNKSYGYLNLEGEKVIKLSSNIKEPSSFLNGYATFKNSDNDYGTIDEEGEIVIRAKYDELNMYNDFILYEDDNEWGFLSYSGDVIKRACYKKILPFFEGNKYTYAKDGDEWILVDKKGEDTKKVEVDNIGYYDYDNFGYPRYVESDYFDIDAEVMKLMSVLNENGTMDKTTFEMMPEEFANTYNREYKPNELQGKKEISTNISSLKYADRGVTIIYNEEVIKADYKREWVSNRWGGYYDDVISGYSYNHDLEVDRIVNYIHLNGKLTEKSEETYSSMCKWLEDHAYILSGSEEKESRQSKYYKKGGISLGIHFENRQINIATSINKEAMYAANKAAGEKFLDENARNEGVKVTQSGLQYKIIKEGKGEIPTRYSKVKVNYKGMLIDGTEFANSYKYNTSPSFIVEYNIKGWVEALTMMSVGSKWIIYVPQELGYADDYFGEVVKPFSTVIYEIELLSIEK